MEEMEVPDFMKDLPDYVIEEAPPQFRHNWMYAMIPAGGPYQHIYLAGYCKVCQKSITVQLPISGDNQTRAHEAQLEIPRWGCIDGTQIV